MPSKALFDFIKSSPCAYYTVDTVKRRLLAEGFSELFESDKWELSDGGKYFVIRGGTSVIAFVNRNNAEGYTVAASHSDSPAFKVKVGSESVGAYVSLPCEKYGGSIHYTWLDRPLSVAGRVIVRRDGGADIRLVNVDSDALVIPSLAIHMNRAVNDGYKFSPAKDLIPLVATKEHCGAFMAKIADEAGCSVSDIIAHDLFLYVREEGRVVGVSGEFALAPRIDDLAAVYSSLEAFLTCTPSSRIPVIAVFDNEEVGNETKQGAKSTFLPSVLSRISGDANEHNRRLSASFIASVDNAHAKHPNFPELSDSQNAPLLRGGIAIKYNSNQRYATEAVADSIFREVCRLASVRVQSFTNRPDMLGGTTLGSAADTLVSVPTVDIGIPQLAMHSAVELCAPDDVDSMTDALRALLSASIKIRDDKIDVCL